MVGWFEKTLVFKMKKIACLLGIVHVAHNFYVSEPYIYIIWDVEAVFFMAPSIVTSGWFLKGNP